MLAHSPDQFALLLKITDHEGLHLVAWRDLVGPAPSQPLISPLPGDGDVLLEKVQQALDTAGIHVDLYRARLLQKDGSITRGILPIILVDTWVDTHIMARVPEAPDKHNKYIGLVKLPYDPAKVVELTTCPLMHSAVLLDSLR
jgi:hypothetical protein